MAGTAKEPAAFRPHWPDGLKQNETYRIFCDDKGRNEGSWLQVFIAEDGDAHVMMQEWEDIPEGEPMPIPSVRVRTHPGGGRNWRTRQALLWLADAIRRDNEENTKGPSNVITAADG
jgi:hypothetical protein